MELHQEALEIQCRGLDKIPHLETAFLVASFIHPVQVFAKDLPAEFPDYYAYYSC